MRYILLMRHAKSSWDNRSQSDHARPLNLQGQNASEAMAKTLHAKGFAPDEIWASDSARTTETAKIIMRVLPGPQTVKYNPKLYHASGQKIIEQINAFPPPEGNL